MKIPYTNCETLFTYLCKGEEGEYIVIKNATKNKTWFIHPSEFDPARHKLYANPETAYRDFVSRVTMPDGTFAETVSSDYFIIPVCIDIVDGIPTGFSCYGESSVPKKYAKYIHEITPSRCAQMYRTVYGNQFS